MSGLGGGPYWLTGQYIRVIGDAASIRAELWDAPTGGNFIGQPSGGPNLTGDGITVASFAFLNPTYCDVSDQVSYSVKNEWPYADYVLTVDHPSCTITVCDLEITGYTVTNESTVGASDGQIALTATSSNGTIEFSLTSGFAYGTGQASPITGLSTGNYVVYAKDPAGCTDQINVFVGIDFTYGVKWRLEYDRVHPEGYVSRIDIEQRDYVGSVIEICGGARPFLLEYNPEDDSQVVASMATLELLVESEGQFNDIRVGDDRQHIVKKYLDTGSGFVLEWTGYITPEFYQEPYIFEPYVITIKAIDGLGELKNKDFLQDSGEEYFGSMSVIKIISECLKKIPIPKDIHSCINIFEENMDTDHEDDPLAQVYIKTENYRGRKCEEVISDLIKPFTGAELFQSFGVWWIRTREQSVDSTLNYRVFDKDGIYDSNDTIDGRKSLGFPSTSSRMCFIDRSQLLNYGRPYGKVTITHDLDKDNNILDTGGFELADIDASTEFFRYWNIFPLQAGITSGMEYVDNGQSKGAFFFQWLDVDDQKLNSLVSNAWPISIGSDVGTGNIFENAGTSFKLKFQVHLSPTYNVPWIWVGWKLRFTDVVSGDFWDWHAPSGGPLTVTPPVNVERINDLYVSDYNSWKTYEFYGFRTPGDVTVEDYTIQLSFYFHNHKGRDFDDSSSFADLKAVVTEPGTGVPNEGKRYYVSVGTNTFIYELQHNTDSESHPDIVRPDDYHVISNPFQWVKTDDLNPDGSVPFLDKILIDNVSISLFTIESNLDAPGFFLIDPPETLDYSETITDRNEYSLSVSVNSGDVPKMVGAEYIYNGFYTLSDGTATKLWFRHSVPDERQKLLEIYMAYLTAQGALSKRLLSGSGRADIQIGYINSMVDQIDNRKYRFVRYALDDKQGQYDFELEETLVGEDGESPPLVGEFSNDFSDDFNV